MNGINGIGNAFQPIQAFQRQQEQQPQQQPAPGAGPGTTYSNEAEYNPHLMLFTGGSATAQPNADSSPFVPANAEATAQTESGAQAAPSQVKDGLKDAKDAIDEKVKEYQELTGELTKLTEQYGPFLTPEQLDKKIAEYKADPEKWDADKIGKLEQEIADSGKEILDLTASNPDAAAEILAEWKDDPVAQAAMQAAIQQDPSLLEGPQGDAVLSALESATWSTDAISKIGESWMNGAISKVLEGGFDPNDTALLEAAKAKISELADSPTAKAIAETLGIDTAKLSESLNNIGSLLGLKPGSPEMTAQLEKLNTSTDGFGDTTLGKGLKAIGFAIAATQLVLTDNGQDAQSVLAAIGTTLGLTEDVAKGLGQTFSKSILNDIGEVAGAAGTLFGKAADLFSIRQSIADGNWISAATSLVTLFSSGIAGILIGALGSLVEVAYDQAQYDKAIQEFLEGTGYDQETINAMVEDKGYALIDAMKAYADHLGMDSIQELTDWVNGLDEKQIKAFYTALEHAVHFNPDIDSIEDMPDNGVRDGYQDSAKEHAGNVSGYSNTLISAAEYIPQSWEEFQIYLEAHGIDQP